VRVADQAGAPLEQEEADAERDVREGELESRGEVPTDPQGPERDPDRERGGALVDVESAGAGGGFWGEHASCGPKPEGILYPCGRTPFLKGNAIDPVRAERPMSVRRVGYERRYWRR